VKVRQRKFTRWIAVATGAALSVSVVLAGTAGAQSAAPGVTDKDITVGYITSETGAAASIYSKSQKACQARVDAQNAKGGVNGRKIKLESRDDKSAGNLTAAQDLVQNSNAFMVVDNSALAFLSYRYLLDAGVPMIGPGFDGTYYFDKGNENIISGVGNQASLPGLTYDTPIRVMKRLGAKKVASIGYGVSPSSSEAATLTSDVAAPALGLKGVYVNNTLDFGSTDVGPVVLGIKNSGADGAYLPLNADTNFAIVQGLQQNGVDMKANVLATGYGQALLDQPVAKTMTPADVIIVGFRPMELKNAAVKDFQANLKKYAGLNEIPDLGMYTGYINCDMMIKGLEAAGKNPTRASFVAGVRGLKNYDGAGLTCQPLTLSAERYGKVDPTACTWMLGVKNGKFVVLNGGKPITGKIVGSPELLAKYGVTSSGTSSGATTTIGAS
jgi:branched-chain amino acid transport system substrate-binding protein